MTKTDTDVSTALQQQGNAYFGEGKYKEASVCYTYALQQANSEIAAALYSNRSACFLMMGQFAESLKDADQCILVKPKWVKSHYRRGMALMGLGKHEAAVTSFEFACRLDSGNKELETRLAEAKAKLKDDKNEDKAKNLSPWVALLHDKVVPAAEKAAAWEGNILLEVQSLEEQLANSSDDDDNNNQTPSSSSSRSVTETASLYYRLAMLKEYHLNDWLGAEKDYVSALATLQQQQEEEDKTETEETKEKRLSIAAACGISLASLLERHRGDNEAAKCHLQTVIDNNKQDYRAKILLGDLTQDASLVRSGVSLCTEQGGSDSIAAAANFSLGRLTDDEEAIPYLEKAVDLDKNQPLYSLTLGYALWTKNKDKERAKECFTTALSQLSPSADNKEGEKEEPNNNHHNNTLKAECWLHLGVLYSEGFNDMGCAESAFRSSLQCGSSSTAGTAYFQLGCLLDRKGDASSEAEQNYRKALVQQPTMTAARLNLAHLLAKSQCDDDKTQALKEAMQAVKYEPTNPKGWLTFGTVLAGQDKVVEAQRVFQKLIGMEDAYAKHPLVQSVLAMQFTPPEDGNYEDDGKDDLEEAEERATAEKAAGGGCCHHCH